jgi:N-acetyl-gamma-glutamyl-phosphate reductase
MVAARLLADHPRFELVFCTSDRWVGDAVRARTGASSELRFVANAEGVARAADVDAICLATSAEVSHELAPKILAAGAKVVDFSGAFRLESVDVYPRWYKLEHREPALLAEAHYGIPELFGSAKGKRLVANPGCYPTAAVLPIAPLLRDWLIDADRIFIDGKSGVTGAGRQSKEDYSFVEVDSDLRAYKLLSHQHTPEIARVLERAAGKGVGITFTPHLIPIRRGLICTAYAKARPGTTTAALEASLRRAYEGRPFVEVVRPEEVTVASVVGTNVCRVGVACDGDVVVAIGAIDNLIKGAAGQAVQNLNTMFGDDEGVGLDRLHRSAP